MKTEVEKDLVEGFEITKTPTLLVYLEEPEIRSIPGGCDEAAIKAIISEILFTSKKQPEKNRWQSASRLKVVCKVRRL